MPSGPNAENAKNLYEKGKAFKELLEKAQSKDPEALRALKAMSLAPKSEPHLIWGNLLSGDTPATPKPRTATEALGIVGEGNMGANVPMGRKGAPKRMRKGRLK
jgi:hypothetical protein